MQNTKFIAEIGSNHNQDLARAFHLIDKAKDIGCWAVKFQYYKADKLWHSSRKDEIEVAKKGEVPDFWLHQIKEKCAEIGLKYGCSIYEQDGFDVLAQPKNRPDFIKISSFDILNYDFIKDSLLEFDTLFLSTGHAILDDLYEINKKIKQFHSDEIILFHCVSNYPTKPEDAKLHLIDDYRFINFSHLKAEGYSDHTTHPMVIYTAVLGSQVEYVEFHLDLEDEKGNESKFRHCWKPDAIKEVIDNIKIAKKAYRNIHPYVKNPESQLRGDWE